MTGKALTVWDQEALYFIAEEVIVNLRYQGYWYDEEGNRILEKLSEEERRAALENQVKGLGTDYLSFRENEELHQISFGEALEMPLSGIKETYLKDVLPKARNILRKGSMQYGYVVSDEVPDSYLDDLLALRWRENLKLWTIQWDYMKRGSKEEP